IEITDLKNARESSNKAEALNKTIIDSIPGPFYIIDENGNYAGWNAFDREIIAGKPESEMSSTRVIETVHPDDRALVEETIATVMKSGIDGTVEGRILLRGGPEFRWFSMSGRRVIIDGHPLLVGIGTDITERKKIENVQYFLSYTSYASKEEPFFNALARFLAETLSMDFVCIDILEGDGLSARTLAVWCDGHFEDNIVYTLDDTPCGAVVREDICCFPANVCQFFPRDQVLRDLNAESYAGITLMDHSGHPIGLIAVIGRDKLDDRRLAENVLKAVSVRAAGELERLMNETALRKSEKKYRDLFENVPIGLYQSTMDGKIISANRRCLDMCRCKAEDMDAWFGQDKTKSCVNPKDGARLREMLMKEGFVDNYEAEFFRMDNTTFWLSNTARLIKGENGEQDIISGSFVDITNRKEAEKELKKLSAAIEQSPAVVVITDPEGNIEYVNPEFSRLTGYLPKDVKGRNPRILQSGFMAKDTYKELWQTILSGEIWRGELHNRKKNGELYWEMAVISALRNHNGDITNFVAVKEDITEKKILWNDLVASKEKAEESDRLKSAFVANISHEIRTPMNGILGFSALLKEPRLSGEEQQEYIDLIQQSGERMLGLINDLIDISRIDANEAQINLAKTSLNKVLHSLCAFFNPEAEKKKLDIRCRTGLSDNESIVVTDSGKLNQVMTNLVQNALKFTIEGHIDIGYEKKDNMLEFYVADSGIGIPAEMKERIFDRFRQIDNSLSRLHQGAGLGLSISKALVEMLGGKIWVESAEWGGSRFVFTLPYNPSSSTPSSRVDSDRTVSDTAALPNLNVLIAEDDEISRLLLQKILRGENITLLSAENGKEAVRIVEDNPDIDLVLMDIKMPEMNGYEATRLIKKIRPSIPVIAQSAFTSTDERKKALEAGCDAFLHKPIKKNELLLIL
ncbi:MAG: PAS domain S-box protein, partial [Chlorobiaceae bacterium]|nr:PAS domain S-box protein [Chlorobiaceae bacterium]